MDAEQAIAFVKEAYDYSGIDKLNVVIEDEDDKEVETIDLLSNAAKYTVPFSYSMANPITHERLYFALKVKFWKIDKWRECRKGDEIMRKKMEILPILRIGIEHFLVAFLPPIVLGLIYHWGNMRIERLEFLLNAMITSTTTCSGFIFDISIDFDWIKQYTSNEKNKFNESE